MLMPIQKEPKYETIINRGEYHIPVVVVLDISWQDKKEYKQIVSQNVTEFLDAAKEDSFSSGRLDICFIASNNGAQILYTFLTPDFLNVPNMDNLDQNGECDMDATVQRAVEQIEQRICLYKKNGVSTYNPALYIFSGRNKLHFNDTTVTLVKQKKECWNLSYFLIPLNGHKYIEETSLSNLFADKMDKIILQHSDEEFKESFEQLSLRHSVSMRNFPRESSQVEQLLPSVPEIVFTCTDSDFDYLKGVHISQEVSAYIKALDDILTTKGIPHYFNWTDEGVCELNPDTNCTENRILVFFKGKLVKITPDAHEKISVDSISYLNLSRYKLLKIDYELSPNALSYIIHGEYNMYVYGSPDSFAEYLLERIKQFKEEWDLFVQIFAEAKRSPHKETQPPTPSYIQVGI